jgi:hypothetical protein
MHYLIYTYYNIVEPLKALKEPRVPGTMVGKHYHGDIILKQNFP